MAPVFDILGIGTVAVDDLIFVENYPAADVKIPIQNESRHFGGLVGTALAVAAKLTKRCAYAGTLGNDDLSNTMKDALVHAGIEVSHLVIRDEARPIHSVIIADQTAHTRNIFFDLRRFHVFPESLVTEQLIASTKVLFIDQFGMATATQAAKIAKKLSIPVVADMEWPEADGTETLMTLIDHLIVPRDFAAAWTGQTDPATMVEKLHQSTRACTAVTCGTKGCFYRVLKESETKHVPAIKINPVETTGCGDVFHGAYAAALASEMAVDNCLRFASAAAAIYAGRPTGWNHLPGNQDIKELLCR